jgi:hypothetical protein
MRALFVTVAKVCGLVQIYSGLMYITAMLPILHMLGQSKAARGADVSTYTTFYGENIALTAVSMTAMLVLTFGVAWLLLFRAVWLADKLRIPATDGGTSLPVVQIIRIGTKLIGLYVIVQGLPSLIQAIIQMRHTMPFGIYMWSTITPPLVRIAIGAGCVAKTDMIVKFITRKERPNPASEAIGAQGVP